MINANGTLMTLMNMMTDDKCNGTQINANGTLMTLMNMMNVDKCKGTQMIG